MTFVNRFYQVNSQIIDNESQNIVYTYNWEIQANKIGAAKNSLNKHRIKFSVFKMKGGFCLQLRNPSKEVVEHLESHYKYQTYTKDDARLDSFVGDYNKLEFHLYVDPKKADSTFTWLRSQKTDFEMSLQDGKARFWLFKCKPEFLNTLRRRFK